MSRSLDALASQFPGNGDRRRVLRGSGSDDKLVACLVHHALILRTHCIMSPAAALLAAYRWSSYGGYLAEAKAEEFVTVAAWGLRRA